MDEQVVREAAPLLVDIRASKDEGEAVVHEGDVLDRGTFATPFPEKALRKADGFSERPHL
jgi:hypothetical protein